jgi:hypothetical protein
MSCVLILPEASIGKYNRHILIRRYHSILRYKLFTASALLPSSVLKLSTRDINLRLVCVRINNLVLKLFAAFSSQEML